VPVTNLTLYPSNLLNRAITSAATVTACSSAAEEKIVVKASTYKKCERCWHYRADVGAHAEHPGLCGRCHANLFGAGEKRRIA
jgi:isoleucyl-tRNA synthetase